MKDYKEKLELARDWYNNQSTTKKEKVLLENLFPELKESEEERIRKEIIQFLQLPHPQFVGKRNQEKWIDWLEKQGEQKTVSKTEPIVEGLTTEFQKQVSHLIASAMDKEHDYNWSYVKWAANALLNYAKHELEKQCEQKPAWSEEDDYILNLVGQFTSKGYKPHPKIPSLEFVQDWLKSLKERYTWKPSDEQMEALWNAIPHIPNSEKDIDTITELSVLYEDLKKIKEG